MSTQTEERLDLDLDLEDLERLNGEEKQHAICSLCYPPPQKMLSAVVTLCGKSMLIRRETSKLWRPGEPRCSACVELVNSKHCPRCGANKW